MNTVIIPAKNAAGRIGRLLAALRAQTIACEILVADSSDSGETAAAARPFGAEVIRIPEDEFDHGGTRSLAAERAKGEILFFLTQDAVPVNNTALETLLEAFRDPQTAAAYGRQLPSPGATPFGAHLRLFNYPGQSCVKAIGDKENYKIKTPFLSNSFAAYRKTALSGIGWFRRSLIMGEDVCAGAGLLMAGYKIAYVAEAAVYHSHDYSVSEEFRRYFDIGVFHRRERWILEEFGRAEGEGRRFILSEMAFLGREGKYHLIPEALLRDALKYAGYFFGRNYQKIPGALRRKMSMHRKWWGK